MREPDGALVVHGADAPTIGRLSAANAVVLHELTPSSASLEDAYFELTGESVEYRAEPALPGPGHPGSGTPNHTTGAFPA